MYFIVMTNNGNPLLGLCCLLAIPRSNPAWLKSLDGYDLGGFRRSPQSNGQFRKLLKNEKAHFSRSFITLMKLEKICPMIGTSAIKIIEQFA